MLASTLSNQTCLYIYAEATLIADCRFATLDLTVCTSTAFFSLCTSEALMVLQFAFLAFLVGQSLEGFMQWKNLLTLLLSCERAPLQVFPGFYAKLLDALEARDSPNKSCNLR